MNSRAVCEAAGVTYRQLDTWARTGLLTDTANGCGSRREWSVEDARLAALLGLIDGTTAKPATVTGVRRLALQLLTHVAESERWTGYLVLCADGEVLRCPTTEAVVETLGDGVQQVRVIVLEDIADAVALRARRAA